MGLALQTPNGADAAPSVCSFLPESLTCGVSVQGGAGRLWLGGTGLDSCGSSPREKMLKGEN